MSRSLPLKPVHWLSLYRLLPKTPFTNAAAPGLNRSMGLFCITTCAPTALCIRNGCCSKRPVGRRSLSNNKDFRVLVLVRVTGPVYSALCKVGCVLSVVYLIALPGSELVNVTCTVWLEDGLADHVMSS